MLAFYCLLSRVLHDRKGVTAVEYAVIAGVLVTAVAGAFTALGTGLSTKLGDIVTAIAS